ncbi:MAG: replicative DNA helicase [Alphaproteobacteria bacterium]|nr:MAG: replicative DNA helicase [Alphaproteobacteria bacterium]
MLPHNTEAEQGLLGALMFDNRAYERVAEFLRPEHFYDPIHGRIYHHIVTLVDRGQRADAITLRPFFEREPELVNVGGAAYLSRLEAGVVAVANAADYGKMIYDLFLRRELAAIGEEMLEESCHPDINRPATDLIEDKEHKLYTLASTGETQGGPVSLDIAIPESISLAEAAHKRDSHITGVTTGLRELDRLLGGLHSSDLVILAGRPSMGKTALATNMGFVAARRFYEKGGMEGAPVAFFSLEMSTSQLATRILADVCRVPSHKIRRGEVKSEDFVTFTEQSKMLRRVPFYIDDTPSISVAALRTRARRLKRTSGLGMIVVDYLQLMRGPGGRREENRVQELSEITRGLKSIAKELNVPVLALSQLSRATEARDDKRPQLSDLRESGSIEQDADVVMFVFREEYYHERAQPTQGANETVEHYEKRHQNWQVRGDAVHNIAEVIVAKQRHGPIGTVRLHFEGAFTRFSDLAEDRYLPED